MGETKKTNGKKVKYVFISGGVISGIGKGITSASIALLLKNCGYKVVPLKFENYLNLDAGTINPIEHGDPFLCEDGTEGDMDIGTYEKFLSQDMGVTNFVTMGKIYHTVIERERRFEYNGEDVEAIPHITDEIIARIDMAASAGDADIVLIELGGTAGEYQNVFYYEASRQLTMQRNGDVAHIHVSYVPTPGHLGEPKTKPTQLSVKTLNSMGIQPDFIVARCEKNLDDKRKEKLALFCNIPAGHVISNPDVDSVYKIPIILHDQKIEEKLLEKLGLVYKKHSLTKWQKLIDSIDAPKKKTLKIGIVGKYFSTGEYHLRDSYAALFDAIDHAKWHLGCEVLLSWISAEQIEKSGTKVLEGMHGIIVPIGWGERGAEGMIMAANYAREKKIPYFGLCYGMQLAIVAYARGVMGWKDANTEENDKNSKRKVIHIIPRQKELLESKKFGGSMRLGGWDAVVKANSIAGILYQEFAQSTKVGPNTKIPKLYENLKKSDLLMTSERHRHRYEFNDEFLADFEKEGLNISGRSVEEGLCEIIELPKSTHPFYLATQGHPEYKSRPESPHPFFVGLLRASAEME